MWLLGAPCIGFRKFIAMGDQVDAEAKLRFEAASAGVFIVVDFAPLLEKMGITVEERLEAARKAMINAGVFVVRESFVASHSD